MATAESNGYPRPLTVDEHDLIEAMLGGVRSGISRFIGQLETAQVIGGCGCGCPSVNLMVDSKATEASPSAILLADAESPEGVPVGVILWARSGCLSGLEVHPWGGADVIRIPHSDTLRNLRTAS
jgi:hypothetical protein